jgi:hypothetical protein
LNNTDEVLGKMAGIMTTNTKTVSMLGARSMVLGAFFDAALPYLTTPRTARILSWP